MLEYFKNNKPGWSGLIVSFALMLCSYYGMVQGYVQPDTVLWWVCVTLVSATMMAIWTVWWKRRKERNALHRENLLNFPMYTFYHGTQEAFQLLFYKKKDQAGNDMPEFIIGSSILYRNTIYAAMAPGRHHHCLRLIGHLLRCSDKIMDAIEHRMSDQGFVTSYGRHVNRAEAFMIAVKAQQLIDKVGSTSKGELYSEDLWSTTRPFIPHDYMPPDGWKRIPRTEVVEQIYKNYMDAPQHFEQLVRSGQDISTPYQHITRETL